MKKLLLIVFCFISLQSAFAYDAFINGVFYNLLSSSKEAVVTWGPKLYSGAVTIPEKVTYSGVTYEVTEIDIRAFTGCSSLTTIDIPNSVTSIGSYAFSGCSSLTMIEIPNSVTSIGSSAFYGCINLTTIELSNSVTSIESFAFSGCNSLTTIDIPNSVTSIGASAFSWSSNLTTIKIPNSVTSIGNWTFRECINLISIDIPNSVTSIGNWTFALCRNLTSIDIPNSVTSIGSSAFENCTSLNDIILSENITSLSSSIFKNCENLSSITLPKNISGIEEFAFSGCTALAEINCKRTTAPTLTATSFENVRKTKCKVNVPAGSVANYTSATEWNEFMNILEEGEKEQWGVSITAGLGGETTINGSSDKYLSANAGSDVVIKLIPDEGYELDRITVNGVDVTSDVVDDTYNISAISEAKNVDIIFKRLPVYLIISHADNGQVKVKVTPDMSQEVILCANPKWELNSVTFNGVDVTSEVSADGIYVTPIITKSAELNISLQNSTITWTNVSYSERLRVMAVGRGKMRIDGGTSGENIDIYTISGSMVTSIECTGETVVMSVNENNAYIVKMNDQVVKIQM